MKITSKEGGVKHIQIALTRPNGKSHIGFFILGDNLSALAAGFQAIQENEEEEALVN